MRIPARTILLLAIVALVAAACSTDTATDEAASAQQQAEDVGSFALLSNASEDLADQPIQAAFSMMFEHGDEAFSIDGEMAIDPPAERARFSYQLDGIPGTPTGSTMDMIVDGNDLYVRAAFLPDAGWLKIDGRQAGLADAFDMGGHTDPSSYLEYLQSAEDVEIVGTENVNGVDTTHFRGTVNLGEAAKRAGKADAIDELEKELGDVAGTFDAWVDGDGVPRRVVFGFAPSDGEGSFEMRVDVVSLGEAVTIDPPAADQVTDLGQLHLPTMP
jgi:hypothetical protein